ncbi:MAG: sarcosine oxidase subunit delta [Actinomycetota bacterium]|jgi:heterotetrameric sarcosine oxidase delta subunit|nr:sarcosine oxidase subunit delta [Actinomycetota bacterium]
MIQLRCPWCGLRNAGEFHYGGNVRPRPDPAETTQRQWRDYLYFPGNPYGQTVETWYHRMGCRRFFTVERDTVTNEAWTLEEKIR